MNLQKFTVLKEKKDLAPEGDAQEIILLNLDQVVSIKPINMVVEGNAIKGFWIRLTNGKKYKATKIPANIITLFGTDLNINELGVNAKVNGNEISVQ